MQLEEVAGGVFFVEASHTNFVLIVDGTDVTMVDSGYPKDRDLVDASVARIFTPGHTEGHCGLHLPDNGVLVTGDALITVDLWDAERRGPQMIRRQFNYDHDQAIQSLDRFTDLEADVIVPGHGEPWRGHPREAVAQAREAG